MKDIYDVCMFFNENDLLEIRLHEHNDFVKKFIIIESLQTHAGHSKQRHVWDNPVGGFPKDGHHP